MRLLAVRLVVALGVALAVAACGARMPRPHLPPGHEGGDSSPYPLTYTKQADNPGMRYGMFYNLDNYQHCLKLYNTPPGKSMAGCDYLRLTRPNLPEYWPNGSPPPIKYPEAPAEPTYKPGMTSEQYFNALCEKESGDFVFKTVKDVESLYLVRPHYYQGDQIRRELFANEAPYAEFLALQADNLISSTDTYRYVEFPDVEKIPAGYIGPAPPRRASPTDRYLRDVGGEGPYWRYWRDVKAERQYPKKMGRFHARERVKTPRSRYGLTWRAIERTGFDRDLGVAGTEALIVDLVTGEVLAYRRGFIRAGMGKPEPFHGRTGAGWRWNWQCPAWEGNRSATTARSFDDFITKVLVPAPPAAEAKGN